VADRGFRVPLAAVSHDRQQFVVRGLSFGVRPSQASTHAPLRNTSVFMEVIHLWGNLVRARRMASGGAGYAGEAGELGVGETQGGGGVVFFEVGDAGVRG
jgi:hypothetical protein